MSSNLYIETVLTVSALALLTTYHILWIRRLRRHPLTTSLGSSLLIRQRWVTLVMSENRDILAIQTLRNWTMAATFLASTAILIGLGILNVAITSERLARIAHVLNLLGSRSETLWVLKLALIAVICFATFLSFTLAIRYYNHAAFLLVLPEDDHMGSSGPQETAQEVNRGAICYHLGMRGYYLAMTLTFWLLGPLWLLLFSVVLTLLLRRMDRHHF